MPKFYEESNRYTNIDELLKNPLLTQIPSDPQPAEIVEILAKEPTVIAYMGNLLSDIDLSISNTKLLLTKAKRKLESTKTNIRFNTIKEYRKNLDMCLEQEIEVIKSLMSQGYTRAEAKEIVRLRRPEKPRESDLSDKAEYLTRAFVQTEIEPLEQKIITLQKNYDDLKVKHNLFESNFKASQSIKGLITKDMDKY